MLSIILIFLSGMFEGVMDTLNFHYKRFKNKHKKAKDNFWYEEYAWLNKYDESFAPKFFLSTTVLVAFTSGWHLMKLFRNIALFASIGLAVYYHLEINVFIFCVCSYIVNRLGFVTVYNWFYK